ncbi:Protein of unknown function [Kytococcus aerolatus]|uniref:DUF3618 domain-containing protein n=1 Tax=Kytococcus aerolatus TaxID=592308 RepID=A0A212U1C6_9MICO|nr:DUF3618 domain-containing protein [Kytococcus aerolatus]SNC71941.1 Protein of unknown function [Kytococcus aerolatus]
MAQKQKDTRSVEQITRDLDSARVRLAGDVDELVYRAHPKELTKRAKEDAQVKFTETMYDHEGELKGDLIAKGLGGAGAALFTLGLLRRLFYKG